VTLGSYPINQDLFIYQVYYNISRSCGKTFFCSGQI